MLTWIQLYGAVDDAKHLVDEALVRELRAAGADQVHRPVQQDECVDAPPRWRLLRRLRRLLPQPAQHSNIRGD